MSTTDVTLLSIIGALVALLLCEALAAKEAKPSKKEKEGTDEH